MLEDPERENETQIRLMESPFSACDCMVLTYSGEWKCSRLHCHVHSHSLPSVLLTGTNVSVLAGEMGLEMTANLAQTPGLSTCRDLCALYPRADQTPASGANPLWLSVAGLQPGFVSVCLPGAFPASFIWIRLGTESSHASRCISEAREITLQIHCINRTPGTALSGSPAGRRARAGGQQGPRLAARKPAQ